MQDTESQSLRKIDIGVIVTIALAIIGFAFWLGSLHSRVSLMQPEKITEATAAAIAKIEAAGAKLGTTGFGKVQTLKVEDWHEAKTDGFAVLDVTESGKGRVWASRNQKDTEPLRSFVSDSDSTLILVPRGLHFRADMQAGHGTLRWYPLGSD